MKAIVRIKGGKEFSTMKVKDINSPKIQPDQLRVKMIAARINPVDMDLMKGFPGLRYKDLQIGGIDGAGEVLETGRAVSGLKKGDRVFFYRQFSDIGTWAEEISICTNDVAVIPAEITTMDAGSIALPLLTAYEAIMALKGSAGDRILIHGAGGGVGFQAVQLAKYFGMKVIAHAGEKDREDLLNAGADQFIDYKTKDFYEVLSWNPPHYIFDVVGNETLLKSIRLKPRKVVSTIYTDISKIHKTGANLPGVLKILMKMMMRKYIREARKHNVELIGQVTGANGMMLQKAADITGKINYQVKPYVVRDLQSIEKEGLSKSDIGKVIRFNH